VQLAAAVLVPAQLAAHQAVWCLYTIASFATTTLEQAGLAFLPQSQSVQDRQSTENIIRALGVGIGVALGAVCFVLAFFGAHAFTSDTLVHAPMRQIAPWCGLVMVLVGTDVSAQALLISSGYSGFLARSFLITLVALMAFMAYASRWTLVGVWAGLVFFFGVRCAQSNAGALLLRKPAA
jgi:Na+-driven multidrug efflux pump